jgi:xanthine dehydrogenase accessory factor
VNCRYDSPPELEGSGGGQRAVFEAALALRSAGRAFALAIVIDTEGSTYRKAGAVALVADDGRRVGVISGGCLEAGLDDLGREALAAGLPRLASFDTRSDDDLIFGSGSGCRGRMHVLSIPVRPDRSASDIERLLEGFRARRDVVIDLAGLAPDLGLAGRVEIRAPFALVAIGAGPEMTPLLRIVRTLGWYTCVADHRDALLTADRVVDIDVVVRNRPAAAWRELADRRIDAAIVMTHVADTDREALTVLARSDVRYIGLLGPLARRDELLSQLLVDDREALAGRLHAPVGLRLGGDGPEAIALAIAAELQRVFQGAR